MTQIFESGTFASSRIADSVFQNLITETRQFSAGGVLTTRPTVFLSHKHQDLEDLKGLIGLLQNTYGAKVYIDSMDSSMPGTTSGETARRIKQIIYNANKFILLATNNAIESTWCNWELGYGDAFKFPEKIAIFPIKPRGTFDSNYKGHEYMQIYPHITSYSGWEKDYWGNPLNRRGYYVEHSVSNGKGFTSNKIVPLQEWLNQK